MKILVTSMWFDGFGGSEAWCYSVISELLRRGHSVDVYAPVLGKMYRELENIGVKCSTEGTYDLILDNHSPSYNSFVGPIIHTCHGIIDNLDRPMQNAINVAVSKKIGEHYNVSTIIPNGIDTNRFYCKSPVHSDIKKILSLCKTDTANDVLRQICYDVGVEFESMYGKEVFHIEDKINEADLVVGVGRSLLDAMACERPVVSFDDRFYFTTRMMGHGYITPEKYKYQEIDNFTASSLRKTLHKVDLAKEIFEKYNPNDGKLNRKYILDNLSVEQTVNRYLDLYKTI